jgi:hypothetical protein
MADTANSVNSDTTPPDTLSVLAVALSVVLSW